MQERGELVKDDQDRWVEKRKDITWDHLPARVEGVIEKRIERLDPESRRILEVASVEGEIFSAEVVAQVLQTDSLKLIMQLSRTLAREHHLIEEEGALQVNSRQLTRYRFQHDLIRVYLYQNIGSGELTQLHNDVAENLEYLYLDHDQDISLQLAKHFDLAGELTKAIKYYRLAGKQARESYAYLEAAQPYKRAFELLQSKGELEEASRVGMTLGLVYQNGYEFEAARKVFKEAFSLTRD